MAAKKQIEILEEKCKKAGVKLTAAFREAGIPITTIGNWKRKEPDAFDVRDKVETAIEKLAAKKLQAVK